MSDLIVTDWLKLNYYTATWPAQVNVKFYTRAPEFGDALAASFRSVQALADMDDRPEWVPCDTAATSKVLGVNGNLRLVKTTVAGQNVLQLQDGAGNRTNVEDSPLGSGWFVDVGTSEIVAAVVWYIQGTVGGVVNPVLFASTTGLGNLTVVHGDPSVALNSHYGQSTANAIAAGEYVVSLAGSSATAKTITSLVRTSNVVDATTSTSHSMVVGDVFVVAGAGAGWNGTFQVSAVTSPTTFSYASTGTNGSVATGTITKQATSWQSGFTLMDLSPPVWEGSHAQHIWVEPQRVNFIANPSFEGGTDYWRVEATAGASTLTQVTGGVDPVRTKCGKVTKTGGLGKLILESNFFPKTSKWASVSAHIAGAGDYRVGLMAWDSEHATSTFICSEQFTLGAGSATSGFAKVDVLVPLPDDVGDLQLRIESTASTFWVDNVLVDPHEGQFEYFDGASDDGAPGDFMWHGGSAKANAQFSLWYNNYRDTKARLIGDLDTTENVFKNGMLDDWVPTGANIVAHWQAVTPLTPRNWSGDAFYPISNVAGSPVGTPTSTVLVTGEALSVADTDPVLLLDARTYSGTGDLLDLSGNNLNARLGSSAGGDTNDPLFLPFTGEKYVYMPGTASNYINSADSPVYDGQNWDLAFRVAPDDWSKAGTSTQLGYKGSNPTREWIAYLNTDGTMSVGYSVDGINTIYVGSSASLPLTDGQPAWVRYTIVPNNGSGSYEIKFFYASDSPTRPASWTQLGATRTGTAFTLFNGSGGIFVTAGGTENFVGKLYRVEFSKTVGGAPVAVFDAADVTSPYQSCVSSETGETWTLNRSSSGRKLAVVDRPLFLFGTDDYMEVADNDLLDFGASQDFTVVAAFRYHAPPTTFPALLAKRASGPGWALNMHNSYLHGYLYVNDGTTASNISGPSAVPTAGALQVVAGRRAGTIGTTLVDGVGGSTTIVTGSLANALGLRVGAQPGGTAPDFEFLGAAIFRRALSDAEITQMVTYFS